MNPGCATKAYRPCLFVLLLGISACVTANSGHIEQIKTELLTFNDWQVSQTQFCPEEPIVVFAKVTNTLGKKLDLRLIPGDNNRVLVRIVNSNGAVVWDTDELDRIDERRHIEQHGMGRVVAGPGVYHLALEAGASAFWISRWEQRDLVGTY